MRAFKNIDIAAYGKYNAQDSLFALFVINSRAVLNSSIYSSTAYVVQQTRRKCLIYTEILNVLDEFETFHGY